MELKIIVTGKNKKIVTDIYQHLKSETDDTVLRCPAVKSSLTEMTEAGKPDVVIICTGFENRESVRIFDILRDCERTAGTRIIVIGNDDDRKAFFGFTALENLDFLPRPVSLTSLSGKLSVIEDSLEQRKIQRDIPKPAPAALRNDNINTPVRKKHARRHILVVDDDPEQLAVIKEHLREFYEVTSVTSGQNAMRVLAKDSVDLILLDYMMPDMDGPEVLSILRKDPEYCDIPVVFLTGMKDKKAVTETITRLRPQGYILKPSKKAELVAKIIDVIG